jgi:hypothetical protein
MNDIKPQVLIACRLMLRPVARILLRAGVTWKELTDVVKATYVEVASRDFGLKGRPTNISRVSILTGLTRREVRRLRDLSAEADPQMFQRMNTATRLLSGWHEDPEFCDQQGHPLKLDTAGEGASFATLARRYAGDVPATTMLKELLHVGAVERVGDGRVRAVTRYYMPALLDPDAVLRSGSVMEDLGDTLAYNLHREPEDPSHFEGRASNARMPKAALPAFQRFLEQEGQAFLERVDSWLSAHEADANAAPEDLLRLGVGAYWISDTHDEGKKR